MQESFWDFLKKKTEEMPFIIVCFGMFLTFIGVIETITIFEQTFSAKNELRFIIISIGFTFTIVGIVLDVKANSRKQEFQKQKEELDDAKEKLKLQEQKYEKILAAIKDDVQVKNIQKIENKLPPLYTFHGLDEEPRVDTILQNFEIDRAGGSNRNAVYYMWTDTFKKEYNQPFNRA